MNQEKQQASQTQASKKSNTEEEQSNLDSSASPTRKTLLNRSYRYKRANSPVNGTGSS